MVYDQQVSTINNEKRITNYPCQMLRPAPFVPLLLLDASFEVIGWRIASKTILN